MIVARTLLGLPTSLLVLALAQQAHAQEDVAEHEARAQQAPPPPQIIPLAVRKMSLDEGEMFFPEQDYGFEIRDDNDNRRRSAKKPMDDRTDSFGRSLASLFSFGRRAPSIAMAPSSIRAKAGDEHATNETTQADDAFFLPQAYLPPYSVHRDHEEAELQSRDAATSADDNSAAASVAYEVYRRASAALAQLQRRQWSCPSGTASCTDIGYPYSCCATGETCYAITDTGLGPVGCCPSGATCGGAVTSCSSSSTACPASLGGGCCIEGYECAGVGCVKSGSTSTATRISATTTSSTTTTTTSPSTTTTYTGTSGVAPIKPTLTTTDTTSLPSGYCPTGYYACLAVAGSGCCQTGRDCQTTSCAAATSSSTTLVNTNGITVVVPASAAAAAATAEASATCASGWFMCGADAGAVAGCCPSGYSCGTASCTITSASSTAEVQKELPTKTSGGGRRVAGSLGVVLGAAVAVMMLI